MKIPSQRYPTPHARTSRPPPDEGLSAGLLPVDGFEQTLQSVSGSSRQVAKSPVSAPPAVWRFAPKYRTDELLRNDKKAQSFLDDYLKGESKFFAEARNPVSGLTYDGVNLDPKTGEMKEVRDFSAASKECLDLAMCVKALRGDPIISKVVSPEDPSKAPDIAAGILAKKIKSYEAYRKEYPGFNGYFTWFESGEKATPLGEWKQAIPTLDLGEMMWSLMLAEKALRDTDHPELAKAYKKYNGELQSKAHEAFFEPTLGGIRGHVDISDPKDPHAKFSGTGLMTGEHGVHEGQMLITYMDLFGGLTKEQSDKVWDDISMKRVESKYGTTWQGFWASPHEEWAHLFLPYREDPGFADLFRIRQKIRSQNAVEHGYPGFAASANNPIGKGYMSAAGVEGINHLPLEFQDTYTPYGAFPMLLQFAGELSGNVGIAWLHNMLLGPRQQGPEGAGESGDNAGTASAPVKTIDVTFTNLLALSGGLEKETAELMKEKGVYEKFMRRMHGEYEETFGDAPLNEPVDFATPKVTAPQILAPYETSKQKE